MVLNKAKKLLDPEIRAKNIKALRLACRGLWYDLVRPELPDPVFVVGCSRSGTTITYETLGLSPQLLKFGYELPRFWNSLHGPMTNNWDSEAAGTEHADPTHRLIALRYFYQHLGVGRVIDKTCINVMRIPYLDALFPNSKFVFIQRDGRDNISSMMDGWRFGRMDGRFELSQFFGPLPADIRINNGEFRDWAFFLPPGWRSMTAASLEEVCAFQWISANRMALEAKKGIPAERWVHLRYEDIFERPVEMFREAFQRLGLDFTRDIEEKCRHLQPTSIVRGAPKPAKWREHNRAAIERILPTIAPLMEELGYDPYD